MSNYICGTGGWNGPKPGDPSNNSVLSAVGGAGYINVSWTYPTSNPNAVAHTLLYRGVINNFANATLHTIVAGNFHRDNISDSELREYFYWIKLVSINGTEGDLIGPASAWPTSSVDAMITALTGKIDAGLLAQTLKDTIGGINRNATMIADEILARANESTVLTDALAAVQSDTGEALTYINSGLIELRNADAALINSYNIMAAGMAGNTAAILEEKNIRVTQTSALTSKYDAMVVSLGNTNGAITTEATLRANADGSLGQRIDALVLQDGAISAAVQDVSTTKIGYAALVSDSVTPYDGNGTTDIYPANLYPANTYPEYAANRKRVIDKLGVTRWNATGATKQLVWIQGFPLATAVKTVGVTGPDGGQATLEQAFSTQSIQNGKYNAMYTVKSNVNGLIGGFGMLNDGLTVQMGFDVDSFWIGRTSLNKKKPFIIENGNTYIDTAFIKTLTADKIDTRGLTIKDVNGNVILGSGTTLGVNYISGLGSLATKSSVAASDVSGLGSLATTNAVKLGQNVQFPDGRVISSNDLVSTLSKINSGNVGTFIDGAAISRAYIGELHVKNADIDNLAVSTLKIQGNNVTTTGYGEWSSGQSILGIGTDTVQLYLPELFLTFTQAPQSVVAIVTVSASCPGDATNVVVRLDRDGVGVGMRGFSTPNGFTTSHVTTLVDYPSAGTHSYKIGLANTYGNGAWTPQFVSLTILATLR